MISVVAGDGDPLLRTFKGNCRPVRSSSAAGGDFLAVFVPGVDPVALTAGEGVAGGIEHLAHVTHREGVQFLALGVAGVVPRTVLENVERVAVGHHLALAGAEGVHLLAVLVVDVVPGSLGLDVADFLGLDGREGHQHHEDNENSFHNDICLFDDFHEFSVWRVGQQLLQVAEDPLQRLLGRAVTLARLLAQQLFGRGEQ